jgi:S1-C subfamily serine protease
VTVPWLRAQASTPPFGNVGKKPVSTDGGTRDCTTTSTWRGATIENLCAGEFSLVGRGYAVGVFILSVPAGTQAASDGFLNNDVIDQFNGQSVASLDDLNRAYAATTAGQRVTVEIWRNQANASLAMTR